MDHHPPPAAVIFDLDGTLVDTVPTRIAAWAQTFAESGDRRQRRAARAAHRCGRADPRQARRAEAGETLGDEGAERIDHRSGEIYSEIEHRSRAPAGVVEALATSTRGA